MILVNERLPSDKNLTDAARRVHAKLFANYRKWCDRMGVAPRLCVLQAPARNGLYPRDSPSDAGSYIADILLHFLVWGEAANLKHMPEAICFLYHKCKQEHKQFASLSAHKEMYPGYFLDMVITPLYEVSVFWAPPQRPRFQRLPIIQIILHSCKTKSFVRNHGKIAIIAKSHVMAVDRKSFSHDMHINLSCCSDSGSISMLTSSSAMICF